ncbi:hypothetical protein LguiA_028206 [Lonicera macranthoides]
MEDQGNSSPLSHDVTDPKPFLSPPIPPCKHKFSIKSPQNRGISSSKLLRYPLRSATKSKEVRTPVVKSANSTLHKR